ncbi:MAG: NUDIX hydrolase [Anaerolineae bacterium]|nr:NUDIX hydrolase [Anaerolineae bacterium]
MKPYQFCPYCAAPLIVREVAGRERPACDACGFVQFQDPKMAAAVLLTEDNKVLLVRRAVSPRIGYWALPAGFVDPGELPEETAVREVAEETGLLVALGGFMGFARITNPDKPGVLVYFAGHPVGGQLQAQDDVSEARWFSPAGIPWDDLAFSSTRMILESWANGAASAPQSTGENNHV